MKKHVAILVLVLFAAGCNRSTVLGPGRVLRQRPAPEIPSHSLRGKFLGQWQTEAETAAIVIAGRQDGMVTITTVMAEDAPWHSVINNVRWEGDTLCYDEYFYYTGPEDFPTITNHLGDHPYSGVRNEVKLSLGPSSDTLTQTLSTIHVPEPITEELTRMQEEG